MVRRIALLGFGILACGATAQGVVACSSDDSAQPADAGVMDATKPDTGVVSNGCSGPLPVMTVLVNKMQVAPDWSCYGADAGYVDLDAGDDGEASVTDAADAADATEEDTGAPADASDGAPPDDGGGPDASDASVEAGGVVYTVGLLDFASGAPPVGATVDVMWGPLTGVTPAYTGLVVDSAGNVSIPATAPAGVLSLSYHIYGVTTDDAGAMYPVYWESLPLPTPPKVAPGTSVTQSTYDALSRSVLGSEKPIPTLSTLVAGAQDCQGREVQGAQFVIIDGATGTPVRLGNTVGSTRAFYLRDNLPAPDCTYTTNSARAVWSMINAPANMGTGTAPHPYTVRFLGRMTASDTDAVVIDEHPVEAYPSSVTVLRSGRYSPGVF